MKKKTYVFDENTLFILEEIKKKMKKSETQILKEALQLYRNYLNNEEKHIAKNFLLAQKLENAISKLEFLIKEIENQRKG